MNTFVYDGNNEDIQKVINLNSEGKKVLCYKCGAELLIISNMEDEKKYRKKSGIYCTADESHIKIWFALSQPRREFWRKFAPHFVEDIQPLGDE
ncbi:hypothetical protein [Spirulina sp. 06S082]|uniref:hypothetical protein n=1 Tax=Spirulina sp. 06S082 TaxID=3110248 RepID=UPI002B1FAAF0|nr:hypothetical protein [Spirulina sp. 06S082]MEA5472331.1 hypothetical protein [Spirulina sp. 06S082]